MSDMLGRDALAEMAGPLKDFSEKLGGQNSEEWWAAFKMFLRKENPWPTKTLLDHINTFSAPVFSVRPAEILQEKKIGGKKVWLSGNMIQLLGKLGEQTIEASSAEINSWQLKEDSVDGPILRELGERAQIGLAHWLWLIEQQAGGEEGALLTNGRANIAYPREFPDWAVRCCRRSDDEWSLDAYPVTGPSRGYAGHRVFSD